MICAINYFRVSFAFVFNYYDKYIKIKTLHHIDNFTKWNKGKFAKQLNDL